MTIKTNFYLYVFLASCLFSACSSYESTPKTIDLSGKWAFKIDSNNVGVQEKWFNTSFKEYVTLPGTTDENKKGNLNDAIEVNHLTRRYMYIGKAWYQRAINIPPNWNNKTIHLFLERTKATEVWVDSIHFDLQKHLSAPHIYDLSKVLTPGQHNLTISVDNSSELFPTGGSHALAKHTQTNWNGIIGKMELSAKDEVFIKSLKLFPNIENKEAKVVFKLVNPNKEYIKGSIVCEAIGFNGNTHNVKKQTFDFSSNESEILVTGKYKMGDDFNTWDEFNPNLYNFTAKLNAKGASKNYKDNYEASFGMVKFKTNGTQFVVNDKVTILRGKHDACVFPLTGYPPTTKDEWIRQMKICKDYGLNHYRFHSWTPPKAAFEAADIVGIYMQPELPQWRAFKEKDTVHFNFQKKEGEVIFDSYANHPSFVMFALGNELGGSRGMMAKMIKHLKTYDGRSLFAQGSNNYFWNPKKQPTEDFFISARTKKRKDNSYKFDIRASFSFANDSTGGIINGQFPNTERSFESALKLVNVPAIGHETGQYQVLPNFDEIDKYSGILEARNFEVFKRRMIDKKMFSYWKELFLASGKHAAICYKEDNEISMRTPGFGGFQILDLQDFPGQGTALVGMLDAFMDSKGIITPKEWRQSCASQTIQAKMPRLVWQNNETFTANIIAINYGAAAMKNQIIQWSLVAKNGSKIKEGKMDIATFKQGKITNLGDINIPLSNIKDTQQLTFKLSTSNNTISNQYNIWVYPKIDSEEPINSIKIKSFLDDITIAQLEKGAKVLLLPETSSIKANSVGGLFTSDYWCYPMFKGISERNKKPVSPGTLGLLIDDKHPVFNNFPTSFHSDWQWWSIMKKSRPIILDALDEAYRPIVQPIDNFERCSKLGLLFEFKVGKGNILVCSTDLSDTDDFVAQQLRLSILRYMNSEAFHPKALITSKALLSTIYGNLGTNANSRTTNDKGNTNGYDLLN
ncbi:sugar-binding domain-containing protein [Polaribacter sp. M15]